MPLALVAGFSGTTLPFVSATTQTEKKSAWVLCCFFSKKVLGTDDQPFFPCPDDSVKYRKKEQERRKKWRPIICDDSSLCTD
jgi:hypothetical protein